MRRAGSPRRNGAAWSRPPAATRRRPGRRCRASARRTGIRSTPTSGTAATRPSRRRDLTQDFFAYLLERDLIARADPARGRFRAFLRTVCARHLADRPRPGECGQAGRGPAPALHRPPRRRAPVRPRARPRADPGADLRQDLGPDPPGPGRRAAPPRVRRRGPVGQVRGADRRADPRPRVRLLRGDRRRLGTTEGNVRVAVHRLRRRYGLLLREEIAATVGDAAQVDDEIRALFAALEG